MKERGKKIDRGLEGRKKVTRIREDRGSGVNGKKQGRKRRREKKHSGKIRKIKRARSEKKESGGGERRA